MTPVEKSALALAVPALAYFSPAHGLAMATGLMGGWAARVGVSVKAKRSWQEIRQDMMVSLLFSIGSVITTLFFASMTGADVLGVAGIGFLVAFKGDLAFDWLRQLLIDPFLSALSSAIEKRNPPK